MKLFTILLIVFAFLYGCSDNPVSTVPGREPPTTPSEPTLVKTVVIENFTNSFSIPIPLEKGKYKIELSGNYDYQIKNAEGSKNYVSQSSVFTKTNNGEWVKTAMEFTPFWIISSIINNQVNSVSFNESGVYSFVGTNDRDEIILVFSKYVHLDSGQLINCNGNIVVKIYSY